MSKHSQRMTSLANTAFLDGLEGCNRSKHFKKVYGAYAVNSRYLPKFREAKRIVHHTHKTARFLLSFRGTRRLGAYNKLKTMRGMV